MKIKIIPAMLITVLLITAMLTTAGAKTATVGNVSIYRGTATVNGEISADEYQTVITLDKRNMKAFDGLPQSTVPDNFSMKVYLSWDDDGLYVGYLVVDPTPLTAEGGWRFNGDLVQFFADFGPTIAGRNTTDEATIGRRAPLFTTGVDADGILYYLHQCVPAEGILNLVPDGGYKCAGKSTANGWSAEFMIPWQLLIDDINTKVSGSSLSLADIKAGAGINMLAIYNDFNQSRAHIGWYASTNTSDSDPFDWQPEIFGINAVLAVADDSVSSEESGSTESPVTSDGMSVLIICSAAVLFSAVVLVKRKSEV